MKNFGEFIQQIAEAVRQLIEQQGYVTPLTFCVVGANGEICCARYIRDDMGSLHAEILVEHAHDPRGFLTPLNTMVVDARGKAVIIKLSAEGVEFFE
jgi:hypothetical protein